MREKNSTIFYTKRKEALSVMAVAVSLLIGFTYMSVFTAHQEKELEPFYDQTVSVTGEVREVTVNENNTTVSLKVRKFADQEADVSLLARIYGECPELEIGQVIEMDAQLKEPDGTYNEGTFYYPNYLKSQGYFLTSVADGTDVSVVGNESDAIRYLPAKIRAFVRTSANKHLSEENAGLLVGILLGEKDGISEECEEAFRKSGVSHLTAVSGLHVTIILTFAMFMFRKIGNKRSFVRIIYIVGILGLIIITGATPSVVRAGIMMILSQIAWIFKKDADGLTSLGVAAVFILCANPYAVYDTGFQLSFLATLGILLLASDACTFFGVRKIKSKILKFLANVAIVSVAAQLGIFLTLIDSFHTIPVLSVLTNILVAPIVPAVLASGIVFLLLEAVFAPLAIPVAFLCDIALSVLKFLAAKIAAIPFATLPCPSLSLFATLSYIAFFVFLCLLVRKKKRIYPEMALGFAVIFLLVSIFVSVANRNTVTVSYINVGQGDSSLIQTGENISVLIDGGGSEFSDVGEYILDEFLYNRGVLKVSVAVITHFDIDHMDGIRTMIEKGRVEELVVPDVEALEGKEILDLAAAKSIPVTYLSKGEQLYFSENFYLDCLSPTINEKGENNDTSLVLMLHANGRKFFFGGDIGEEKETLLTQTYPEMDVDVLKANHHGSKYSNSFSFLSCVSPEYVVISYGKNSYGHPGEETRARLRQIGANIFETKRDGTITFRVKENGELLYKTSR